MATVKYTGTVSPAAVLMPSGDVWLFIQGRTYEFAQASIDALIAASPGAWEQGGAVTSPPAVTTSPTLLGYVTLTSAATIPAPTATENKQVLGEIGVTRRRIVAYTGDGETTAVKIKHGLATQATTAVASKSASKLPTEQPTTALGKWVAESATEGTYTFTAAPAAKEQVFITVSG